MRRKSHESAATETGTEAGNVKSPGTGGWPRRRPKTRSAPANDNQPLADEVEAWRNRRDRYAPSLPRPIRSHASPRSTSTSPRPVWQPPRIRVTLPRPVSIAHRYQDAHKEMVRAIKRAHADFLHGQVEQSRIRGEIRREAADLTERRRQQYHGDHEQRRIMREEARALLQRETATTAEEPLRRTRRLKKTYEP